MTFTWLAHECYMPGTWPSHHSHMPVIWVPHDCHMTVTWVLHAWHMTGTWVLHAWYMTFTWLSRACHMTVTWLLRVLLSSRCGLGTQPSRTSHILLLGHTGADSWPPSMGISALMDSGLTWMNPPTLSLGPQRGALDQHTTHPPFCLVGCCLHAYSMYVCMYVCMYVYSMYVCTYVCMYACI